MRILAVADSDSRWKWAYLVADALRGKEGQVDGLLVKGEAAPSERQLAEVSGQVDSLRRVPANDLIRSSTFDGYDAVVVGAIGPQIYATTRSVAQLDPCLRPVTITGYPGLVLEKDLEGLLWRIGADVICMNSRRDLARFAGHCNALGVSPDVLVRSGLPAVPDRLPVQPRELRTLTFAVQPDMPDSRRERIYVLERLIEHAEKHPERQVLVKLRALPGEGSARNERFHYEALYREARLSAPPNFEFVYGYMGSVLQRTDLCLTVSSTAAIEALSVGIPVGILTDLGVREDLGNHFFIGSGCLVSFDELLKGDLPQPDVSWLEGNGLGADDRLIGLCQRVQHLLDKRASDSDGLPPQVPWLHPMRTTYLLNRLADQLEPAGGVPPSGWRAAPRRMVRWLLRGPLWRIYGRLNSWAKP